MSMKTSPSSDAIVSTLPLIKISNVKMNLIKVFVLFSSVLIIHLVPVPPLSISSVKRADRISLERILGVVKVGEAVSGQKLLAWTLQ